MSESDIAKKMNTDSVEIARTDVMTGDRDKRMYLYYQLAHSMEKAIRIDIIVSFLMESGVRMLLKDLKKALDHGAHIRILTGNYLGITTILTTPISKKEFIFTRLSRHNENKIIKKLSKLDLFYRGKYYE